MEPMEKQSHLRLVTQDDEPDGRVYLIVHTRFASPGTPRVIAAFADPAVAMLGGSAEALLIDRSQIRRDPELVQALEAWESGDDELFREELALSESVSRSRALHPSSMTAGEAWVPV